VDGVLGTHWLVVNLLTNAIRHNVVGGDLEVRTGQTDGNAFLSVRNTGPQVQPEEVGRLFQPFQRLDRRRAIYKEGHGLGLSIVRAIATAYCATLTAEPMPDGGLSMRVDFPPITNFERMTAPSPKRSEYITEVEFVRT
jgi:signal transduction histidine kinase